MSRVASSTVKLRVRFVLRFAPLAGLLMVITGAMLSLNTRIVDEVLERALVSVQLTFRLFWP